VRQAGHRDGVGEDMLMPSVPTVSIVVVSYNTRDLTVACLKSVIAQTPSTSFELIVLDNASSDGSAEAIAREVPSAHLIRSDTNLGFAAGNNAAARRTSGEYVLLLNPDTVVLDGAIDRLVAFARAHPEAGIWGGRTLFADGSLNPASCAREMTVWSLLCRAIGLQSTFKHSPLFNREFYGGWARDSVRQVDIVSGCFFLIRRDHWQRLGGFDPLFFMYGEEADLCLRGRRLGLRPMVTPDATIVHYGGASEPIVADKQVRVLAAKMTLMRRHWSQPARLVGEALFRLLPLTRLAVLAPVAAVSAYPSVSTQLSEWRQIWARRGEWLPGFSPSRADTASAPALEPRLRARD
jgi:GT2 family glycosyltransferase